ncbi:DUF4190 domain-containing protein [Quadrisphaera sp. DSM 44207]|uniref:DUF4190 domain-containing protein n=1 Tax=Quadrisphaera sp. DSM 44207 TaxID=1881057 RepID=UPI0008891C4C|nr:DUF4190 domain-containing protein [Quadrisphaera sp. DSM 44207]SDQ06726.1 protein of unknown function [Quadrisphaera sp. DSM 44207]
MSQQPLHTVTAPAVPPSTDVMAVLGLVFAFVFSPLGIVFSALGLRNTRRYGTGGRGLAIAGMVFSLLFTAVYVLVVVLALTVP